MKTKLISLTLGMLLGCVCAAHAQDFSPEELSSRTIHRRAVEALIWGMPAVNAELMFQAMVQAKGEFNPSHLLVATAKLEEPDPLGRAPRF